MLYFFGNNGEKKPKQLVGCLCSWEHTLSWIYTRLIRSLEVDPVGTEPYCTWTEGFTCRWPYLWPGRRAIHHYSLILRHKTWMEEKIGRDQFFFCMLPIYWLSVHVSQNACFLLWDIPAKSCRNDKYSWRPRLALAVIGSVFFPSLSWREFFSAEEAVARHYKRGAHSFHVCRLLIGKRYKKKPQSHRWNTATIMISAWKARVRLCVFMGQLVNYTRQGFPCFLSPFIIWL